MILRGCECAFRLKADIRIRFPLCNGNDSTAVVKVRGQEMDTVPDLYRRRRNVRVFVVMPASFLLLY